MELADRIQALRKTKGMSQEELADRLGVSRQAVSKWETGQSTPDLERVAGMSRLFEITVDELLTGEAPVLPAERKAGRWISAGFVLFCAAAAGLWAFTANRFRISECLWITLAGAAAGLGLGLVESALLRRRETRPREKS